MYINNIILVYYIDKEHNTNSWVKFTWKFHLQIKM